MKVCFDVKRWCHHYNLLNTKKNESDHHADELTWKVTAPERKYPTVEAAVRYKLQTQLIRFKKKVRSKFWYHTQIDLLSYTVLESPQLSPLQSWAAFGPEPWQLQRDIGPRLQILEQKHCLERIWDSCCGQPANQSKVSWSTRRDRICSRPGCHIQTTCQTNLSKEKKALALSREPIIPMPCCYI